MSSDSSDSSDDDSNTSYKGYGFWLGYQNQPVSQTLRDELRQRVIDGKDEDELKFFDATIQVASKKPVKKKKKKKKKDKKKEKDGTASTVPKPAPPPPSPTTPAVDDTAGTSSNPGAGTNPLAGVKIPKKRAKVVGSFKAENNLVKQLRKDHLRKKERPPPTKKRRGPEDAPAGKKHKAFDVKAGPENPDVFGTTATPAPRTSWFLNQTRLSQLGTLHPAWQRQIKDEVKLDKIGVSSMSATRFEATRTKLLSPELAKALAPRLLQRRVKLWSLQKGTQKLSVLSGPLGAFTLLGGSEVRTSLQPSHVFHKFDSATGPSEILYDSAALVYEDKHCTTGVVLGAECQHGSNRNIRLGSTTHDLPSGVNLTPEPVAFISTQCLAKKPKLKTLVKRLDGTRCVVTVEELEALMSFIQPLVKEEDPDTGRTVEVCPSNRLHGLQYNLQLFRNRSLFQEGVDAAAEIFTRLSTKVQKILQSELDSVKKQVPTNMPSIVVSPASAPILFTEGVKIASDLKRVQRPWISMLVHSVLDESDLAYGLRPSLRYCHFQWSESCSDQKKKALNKQMDELLALQRKLQPFVDVHIPFCFLRGSFVIKMSCESVVQAHDLLMKKAGDLMANEGPVEPGLVVQPNKFVSSLESAKGAAWYRTIGADNQDSDLPDLQA